MRTKPEILSELRTLLQDAIVAQTRGGNSSRVVRAQAYADGYMRALLESGIATQPELLSLVADERAKVRGPATGACSLETADSAAA